MPGRWRERRLVMVAGPLGLAVSLAGRVDSLCALPAVDGAVGGGKAKAGAAELGLGVQLVDGERAGHGAECGFQRGSVLVVSAFAHDHPVGAVV